jgi:hypothetical protein
MKTRGEKNLGSVSVRTLTVGVKGGSDIAKNNVPYLKMSQSARTSSAGTVWTALARPYYYQSVAPDGPSMPPPIIKETWVAGKQEGQAGSPSYRQLGSRYGV